MKIIRTEKFSGLMSMACLTITSIVFGSLFATPQLLFAQGEANETFFEAAVREAGQTEPQQNQTEAAAPPSPQPSSTEPQQNQTEAAAPPSPQPSSTEPQQNQTEAAPPSPQPSSTEQQNQTQSQNPFEQLGQAISKLFGGN